MDDREEFCCLALTPGANVGSVPRVEDWLGDGISLVGAAAPAKGGRVCAIALRRPLRSPGRSSSELGGSGVGGAPRASGLGWVRIRRVLRDDGLADPPAASTITEILRRHGRLDVALGRARRGMAALRACCTGTIWQMDFGAARPGSGPPLSAHRPGRSPLRPGDRSSRRRAGRDGAGLVGEGVRPLWPPTHPRRQRLPWGASATAPWPGGSPSGCWTWGGVSSMSNT